VALGTIDAKKFHESQFKLGKAKEELEYMKENKGILYKVMTYVLGLIAVSIIGWGTWVTVCAFDIEDIKTCSTNNELKIKEKAGLLSSQIEKKHKEQEELINRNVENIQRQINKRFEKQERDMDSQSEKLDKIMYILINKKDI